MEIKQHNPKQPIGQRKNLTGIQNIFWNKNGNKTYQNLVDAAKAVLTKGKFIMINTKKKEIPQINHLT